MVWVVYTPDVSQIVSKVRLKRRFGKIGGEILFTPWSSQLDQIAGLPQVRRGNHALSNKIKPESVYPTFNFYDLMVTSRRCTEHFDGGWMKRYIVLLQNHEASSV